MLISAALQINNLVLTCARWVRSLIGNPDALPKAVLRKFMVDQHYMSSERGKAGMFPLQQVLLNLFFFFIMTSWLSSDQSRTGVLHKKRAITKS